MCPHMAQTTSKCGLSDQISMVLSASWMHSHLYLELSTCDQIIWNGFKYQVKMGIHCMLLYHTAVWHILAGLAIHVSL